MFFQFKSETKKLYILSYMKFSNLQRKIFVNFLIFHVFTKMSSKFKFSKLIQKFYLWIFIIFK